MAGTTPKTEAKGEIWTGNSVLLSWLMLLVLGGSLLGLYYSSIGYFPEIEWESSLTYLAVLSAIGLILIFLYGFLLFVPGLIWSEALVFNNFLQPVLCKKRTKDPDIRLVIRSLALPLLLTTAAFHWAFTARHNRAWIIAVDAFAFSVLWTWRCLYKKLRLEPASFKRRVSPKPGANSTLRIKLLKRLGVFSLSLLVSIGSLAVVQHLVAQNPNEDALMLDTCSLVVAAANLAVAIYFRKSWRAAVGLAVGAAMLLIVLGNILVKNPEAQLPSQVMRMFGIGVGSHVTLVLSKEADDVLSMQDIFRDKTTIRMTEKGEELGFVEIDDVEILSRLGSDYFLRIGDRRVSLPKSMVISWSVTDSPEEVQRTVQMCAVRDVLGIC